MRMILAIALAILFLLQCTHAQQKIHADTNPNLMSAMTGYNILKGNPFSMNALHDPGFLASYIFNPFLKANDANLGEEDTLHPGVTVRNIRQCDLTLSTDTITTMTEYQKQVTKDTTAGLEFASNVEADVQASVQGIGIDTTVPPLVKSSFSASNSFRESEKFFSQNKGVITINDATCTSYTAHISAYNPPPFSSSFIQALYVLNKTSSRTEVEKDREFFRFIDNFGTHFLSHATMGARLAITRKYTMEEYSKTRDDAIKDCNVQQLSVFFGHEVGTKHDKCIAVDESSNSKIENIYEREFISSYGSRPARDLVDWSMQDFPNPLPVRMTLRPILNLFSATYMNQPAVQNLNIDYKTILKWIAPRYYNFCDKYKHVLGVNTCNAESVKGCGWSDTCDRKTQICVNDKTNVNGYKCCNIKMCSSNPCGKFGKCYEQGTCLYSCRCYYGYTGSNCQYERMSEQKLASTVDNLVKNSDGMFHSELAVKIQSTLTKRFQLKRFSVSVYNAVYGYGDHNVVGTQHYHMFREHGHNIVVGYASAGSKYTKRYLDGLKQSLYARVVRRTCYASSIVGKAKEYLDSIGRSYAMIFASSYGNSVRSSIVAEYTIFINFQCGNPKEKASLLVMLQ